MRLPAPFYARGEHIGIDLPGARVMFTTRRGGFSEGPFASLNLGRLTADRPEAVQRNRAKLQAEVGVPPAHIRQVHGTVVRTITARGEPGVGPLPDEGVELPEADGQATPLRGLAPMVLVADCLPIAVAGLGRSTATARWRCSTPAGGGWPAASCAEGVQALRELGADGPIEAAIGPGAGACCYEVGEEVHAEFADFGPHVRHGRNLDLKAIARERARARGRERGARRRAVHDLLRARPCSSPTAATAASPAGRPASRG